MLKKVLAIASGVVVAMLIIMVTEWVGHRVAPGPMPGDAASEDMRIVPAVAMIAVLVGWFLGTLGGGAVANRIARLRWPAWAIAGLVLLGALVEFTTAQHPAWMIVAGVAAPLLAGWIVSREVPGRSAEAAV